MEYRRTDTFTLAQHLFKLQRRRRFSTNHQHFLRAMAGQVAHQPFNTRVKVPPGAGVAFKFLVNLFRIKHVAGAFFGRFTRAHDAGDFNRRLVLGRERELNGMQFALRKTFHAVTGVTEQHAAGAVTVQQHRNQFLTRRFGAVAGTVRGLQQGLDILLANQLAQRIEFGI